MRDDLGLYESSETARARAATDFPHLAGARLELCARFLTRLEQIDLEHPLMIRDPVRFSELLKRYDPAWVKREHQRWLYEREPALRQLWGVVNAVPRPPENPGLAEPPGGWNGVTHPWTDAYFLRPGDRLHVEPDLLMRVEPGDGAPPYLAEAHAARGWLFYDLERNPIPAPPVAEAA